MRVLILRKIATVLFAGCAIGLVIYLVASPAAKKPEERLVAPVRIADIVRTDLPVRVHAIATVIASSTVQVTARVQGTLIKVAFLEGQLVHKGQLLFEIDPEPYKAALAQAKAALAHDEAMLHNARLDRRRYDRLFADHAASSQQRDNAEANAAALAGTVAADKAAVTVAELNLGYTQIRSPIAGKTGPILIHAGNLVSVAGATPLVTIDQLQPVLVSLRLPEQDFAELHDGARAKPLKVELEPARAGSDPVSGTIDFISNAVDSQTGTVELRATLPNSGYSLLPGQILNASLVLHTIRHAFVVPQDGINDGPNGTYVFAVKKGHAEMRPVRVLASSDGRAAIAGQIETGEPVIVEGQLRVSPGSPVEVVGTDTSPHRSAREGRSETLQERSRR